jgi:valyl-tRNA synthetase
VTDPDRKKMSKSKGNVVPPFALLEEHGSDGVRYWAAKGGPGTDTVFDAGQMKVGRRLAIKLLNASKFILSKAEPPGPVTRAVDRAMLINLANLVEHPTDPDAAAATQLLEKYEYGRALDLAEREFWGFCDDYLELVKGRRYGEQGAEAALSANRALGAALSVYLRLFAPYLPFATEEVWSWWHSGSVHRSAWPTGKELTDLTGEVSAAELEQWNFARELLALVRRQRSEAKQPMKVPIVKAVLKASAGQLKHLDAVETDVLSACRIVNRFERVEKPDEFSVQVEFGSADAA